MLGRRRKGRDYARLPQRVMVGTESWPMKSFEMWTAVWNISAVVGDFIWTAMDYVGETAIGSSTTSGGPDYVAGRHPFPWHVSFCGDIDLVGNQKPQSVYRNVLWGVRPMAMLVHRPGGLSNHDSSGGGGSGGVIVRSDLPEQVSAWGWPDEEESWTWPVMDPPLTVQVRVFAGGCDAARLVLNGQAVATQPFQANLTAVFLAVPYQPGRLTAECVSKGTTTASGDMLPRQQQLQLQPPQPQPQQLQSPWHRSVAKTPMQTSLETTGQPAALSLSLFQNVDFSGGGGSDASQAPVPPPPMVMARTSGSVAFVTITIADRQGRRVPNASLPVEVAVAGPASLAALGNGDPVDPASYQAGSRRAHRGRVLAVVRYDSTKSKAASGGRGNVADTITVRARLPDLPGVTGSIDIATTAVSGGEEKRVAV